MDEVTLGLMGLLIAAALLLIEERYPGSFLRALLGLGTLALTGMLLWWLRIDVTTDTIDFLAVTIGALTGARILDLSA